MKLLQLYRIKKSIDIAGFMASLSSNLADNLTEGIHKIKSKDWDCFFSGQFYKM